MTYAALPRLSDDDRLLARALRARGVDADARVWDDAAVDWAAYDAVVLRSCWDFHRRPAEFLDWIARVDALAGGPRLINGAPLVRFGVDKRYLATLEAADVPVVPTLWVEGGRAAAAPDLASLLAARGWAAAAAAGAVVKPAISASAHETWRAGGRGSAAAAAAQARFARALAACPPGGALMVQPFVPEVQTAGEWSLVFFGGGFSHAVLKRPAPGDFRVQQDFGGSAVRGDPAPRLVADARRALRVAARAAGVASPAAVTYARVDGVARDGRLLLMELECIEPVLFLGAAPGAAARLAALVARGARRRAAA